MDKTIVPEVLHFVNPTSLIDFEDCSFINKKGSMGANLLRHTELKPFNVSSCIEIALVGAPDLSNLEKPYNGAQKIREQFYLLNQISSNLKIADLGNLKMGGDLNETCFALKEFSALLFQSNIRVIVMGGQKSLTHGIFMAFPEYENNINLAIVDSLIPLSAHDDPENENYLDQLVRAGKDSIFNLSFLGYQSYFVDQEQINNINENYFEHLRLGAIRSSMELAEPILRDADLVSFDLGSVRMVDAPGQIGNSPNGLYTEEACQIARYAGISDRSRAFSLFGFCPDNDLRNATAMLSAQIIWYFIEGHHQRKKDYPLTNLSEYNNYIVTIDEIEYPIVFYKSPRTGRWWLEVTTFTQLGEVAKQIVVSCSEFDYLKASQNEIPERWWSNLKKLG